MKDGPVQRAFFGGLIDYAGLFPPAELDLSTAFLAYQEYRGGVDAWMLGRFICPEGKITDLLRLLITPDASSSARAFAVPEQRPGAPDVARAPEAVGTGAGSARFEISVLPAIDWNDADGVRQSFTRLAAVRASSRGLAEVTAVEIKVPDGVPLDAVLARIADASPVLGSAAVFLEPAAAIVGIEALVDGLLQTRIGSVRRSEPDAKATGRGGREQEASASAVAALGLKLRCGGAVPSAFPESLVVARALALCRDHRIPFKATAGLHHPLRHHRVEPALDTWMHGFVNVFGASLLAQALGLEEGTIRDIVEDPDPASFGWDDGSFSWRGCSVSAEEVRGLRAGLVTSFGSCSFEEPRDDLRALGWLR